MARFQIVEGQPGQGKSLYTARLAKRLLERNRRWYERQMAEHIEQMKSYARSRMLRLSSGVDMEKWDQDNPPPPQPVKRRIVSNIKFSDAFETAWPGWITYWSRLDELHEERHVDVLWDEIATELDARNWPNLSPETMRMLSQYRKRGLDIYANTQDFSMVDVRARLMITSVDTLTKLIGSPDPSATKPKIDRVWGVILIRGVENWKETQAEKKKYSVFNWSLMFIEREYVDMYDTTQDIKHGGYPPLRHVVRYCDDPECEVHRKGKVVHV